MTVGLVGALHRCVVVRGREWLRLGKRVADVTRNRAAGAVIAALLNPPR
jgi:hypothetical protein